MSIEQIQEIIESYYNKMVDAMCNDNRYLEQECSNMIDYFEQQKESLEIVLN